MSNQEAFNSSKHELAGQVAFVTGAASGMGKAIAIDLAEHGAQVWGVDTSEVGLRDLQNFAEESNFQLRIDKCDIASASEVVNSFKKMASEFGKCSILVTAAGIGFPIEVVNTKS